MSINIDYQRIIEKLWNKIGNDQTVTDLSDSEKESLKNLGIEDNADLENYKKVMTKIGAQNEYERNVVLQELKKFINRINELNSKGASAEISKVLNDAAANVNTIEEFFTKFNNLINNLETKSYKTEDEKIFDELMFKYLSFSNQFDTNDYNKLKSIVQKSGSGFSDVSETKNDKGITTLKFKDSSGKEYTINTNQFIDNNNKAAILSKLEAVLKEFAEGKLPWNQLGKKLEEFGIDAETLYDNTQFLNNGKTYQIKVVCQGETYSCVCNIEGANDDNKEHTNHGKTYLTFNANEIKNKISDKNIIDTYFTPVVTKGDESVLYIKNEQAWASIGADGTNDLKTLLDKIEENKQTTRSEGSGSTTSLTLNDEQNNKIISICNDIKSKVGLNDSEIEELKKRLSSRVSELISNKVIVDNNFDLYVEHDAISIAADIINERSQPSDGSLNLEDIISKIENHNNEALSGLKRAYDNGLVNIEIKANGSEYSVIVKDKDGTVLCTENYTKNELEKAGFTEYMTAPDSNGNVLLNRASTNENITENEKNAQLLIICSSTTLKQAISNDHVLDNIVGLSYEQAMKLFSELKNFFKDKNYNNIDTFIKEAKNKAKELGEKYVAVNAGTRGNKKESTSDIINLDSPEGGAFMSRLYEILQSNECEINGVDGAGTNKITIKVRTNSGKNAGTLEITKNGITYNRVGVAESIPQNALNSIMQLSLSNL